MHGLGNGSYSVQECTKAARDRLTDDGVMHNIQYKVGNNEASKDIVHNSALHCPSCSLKMGPA